MDLSAAVVPVNIYAFRGVRHVNGMRIRDLDEKTRREIRQVEKEFPLLYTGTMPLACFTLFSLFRRSVAWGSACACPAFHRFLVENPIS